MRIRTFGNTLIIILYVAVIYATLPFGPQLFSFYTKLLGKNTLAFSNGLFIVCGIVLVCVFWKKLIRRSWRSYAGIAFIIAIYAVLLRRYTPIIAEKAHLIEYGFLSYLVLCAFRGTRPRNYRYIRVILIVTLVGCLDEFIQRFLPNRVCELRDVYLNIVSALLGLMVLRFFGYDSEE